MKKHKLFLTVTMTLMITLFSSGLFAQSQPYKYAYISVKGKIFSKKLKVVVDLGDTPEEIKAGKKYSEELSNKKSYASILNYMVKKHFELVETFDLNYASEGTGGTSGIIFIMKKKETLH